MMVRTLLPILLMPVALLAQMRGAQLHRVNPLVRGVAGYWAFDAGTGDKLFDLSGHGLLMTNHNGPTWDATTHGPALKYVDSSTQYSEIDKAPVTLMPLTMNVWFTLNNLTAAQTLIYTGRSDSFGEFWRITFKNDGGDGIEAHVRNHWNSQWGAAKATAVPTVAGKVYMATAVFVSTTLRKMYLDGGNEGTDTTSVVWDFPGTANRLTLARCGDSTPGNCIDGKIITATLWNRALNAAEIAALYRAGPQGLVLQPAGIRPMMGRFGPSVRHILIKK